MKNKRVFRLLTSLLAVVLCTTAFSVTAFAGGGEGFYEPPMETTEAAADDPQLFAYRRSLDGADITVWCNFSPDPCQLPQPVTGTPLLSETLTHTTLAPYGFVVISGQ